MYKKQKGFTLVEMIIVTVIIGILAGVVITVINIPRVQAKSRDSKRVGDLKMIQNALELYFADNRRYPPQVDSWLTLGTTNTDLVNYMSKIPLDPRDGDNSGVNCYGNAANDSFKYYYRSRTNGAYILGGIMEIMNTVDEKRSCTSTDTSNCTPASGYGCVTSNRCYCVQNPM